MTGLAEVVLLLDLVVLLLDLVVVAEVETEQEEEGVQQSPYLGEVVLGYSLLVVPEVLYDLVEKVQPQIDLELTVKLEIFLEKGLLIFQEVVED